MKRDIDYMRELLLKYEVDDSPLILKSLDGNTEKENYHIDLLCDACFLTKVNTSSYRITNKGHDFLANIRDKTVWEKTKETAEQIGSDALPILGKIALGLVEHKLKSMLGMD